MVLSGDMFLFLVLYTSHLRVVHFTKTLLSKTLNSLCFHLLGAILGSVFFCTILHAETNAAGEEIIIYADDTYKPAQRDLGGKDNRTEDSSSTSNMGDGVESRLSEENDYQGDLISIGNEDLWQRIKDGYAIPDSSSALIAKHEGWYSSRPDYMKRMVERSQKYLFHIVEEVEKRGMPTEIALLPMIESAYNPKANSTSQASGIWQFIPSTGKHFGLKQNWWVDNRRNVTFATDAALTYLQKLHTMFGAWDLALAAYNAGEGTVARAIDRNRKLGLPTDYESLNLPAETKNYVPKLQAIKNLMTNPSNYGLQIQTISNTAYFTKVSAPTQIDTHLAAKLAGISDEEFLALNPSYNRPVVTNEGDKKEILLPIFAAQTFRDNLAAYDKPLVSWQTYYAKRGERMDKIASKFGIQIGQLRNVNGLSGQNKIKKTSTILVPNGNRTDFNISRAIAQANANQSLQNNQPMLSSESNTEISAEQNSANIDLTETSNDTFDHSESNAKTTKNSTYKVKKGDTIFSIAKKLGKSTKQITTANHLKNNQVKVGQLLSIEVSNSSTSTQAKKVKTSKKSVNTKKQKTSPKKSNKKTQSTKKSK